MAAVRNAGQAVLVRLEVAHLAVLRVEIGLPQEEPTDLMVDNENVLTLATNFMSTKLTRHISRRELIVREALVLSQPHEDVNVREHRERERLAKQVIGRLIVRPSALRTLLITDGVIERCTKQEAERAERLRELEEARAQCKLYQQNSAAVADSKCRWEELARKR
mgnify:CR=1 FL=1